MASSLHVSPHALSPCGHSQVPAVHVPDDGHAFAQRPQLVESLDSSTHEEPHCERPTAHMAWQVPLEHVSPAAHA